MRVGPDFELMFPACVDNTGGAGFQLFGNCVDDWPNEGSKKAENKHCDGIGDLFDKGFQPRNFLDCGANSFDNFVTKFENWVNLCRGLDGVKIRIHPWHARSWRATH